MIIDMLFMPNYLLIIGWLRLHYAAIDYCCRYFTVLRLFFFEAIIFSIFLFAAAAIAADAYAFSFFAITPR